MELFLITLNLVLIALIGYLAFVSHRLFNLYSSQISVIDEGLTDYELEKQEREKEFDERIERIKAELGKESSTHRQGKPADVLHPGVQNLDHNKIDAVERTPPVEIAE